MAFWGNCYGVRERGREKEGEGGGDNYSGAFEGMGNFSKKITLFEIATFIVLDC